MHLSAGCSQASQQAGAKLTRSDSAPMNISAVPCTYFGRSYVRGVKVKWLRFTKYDRRHGNPVKLETTEAEAVTKVESHNCICLLWNIIVEYILPLTSRFTRQRLMMLTKQRYISRKPAHSQLSSILKFIRAIVSGLFSYSPE